MKLTKKPLDLFFEWSALLTIIFMWTYCFYHFASLPAIIPTHYSIGGQPDDYGSKTTLLLLPGIVTTLVLLLRFLNRFPHKFNYITMITEENAERQYRLYTRIMRYLQFIITLLFSYIVVKTVDDSYRKNSTLGIGFIFLLEAALIIPVFYIVYTSMRKK